MQAASVEHDRGQRRPVVGVQFPRDHARRGLQHRRRRRGLLEVSDHRDAERVRVERRRVRTEHRQLRTAVPALEDAPEAVDKEVVPEIAPAAALHVVRVHRPHHRRDLRTGVVVPIGGVMDERRQHSLRVLRPHAGSPVVRAQSLVGAPPFPAHHQRHRVRRPARRGLDRAARLLGVGAEHARLDQNHLGVGDRAGSRHRTRLHAGRIADPQRFGAGPLTSFRILRIGTVVVLDLHRLPIGPLPVALDANLRRDPRNAFGPGDADHSERRGFRLDGRPVERDLLIRGIGFVVRQRDQSSRSQYERQKSRSHAHDGVAHNWPSGAGTDSRWAARSSIMRRR